MPRIIVGAAIISDGRVLACERALPPEMAGKWEFPGGKVDPGETEVQALVRECQEELGVEVEVGDELAGPQGDGWPMPSSYRMRVWRVRVVRGVPAPIEDHDQLRLLGPGQWLDVDWLPADVPIVRALLEVSPQAHAG